MSSFHENILDAVRTDNNHFMDRIELHDQDAFFDDFVNFMVKIHLALDDPQDNKETCRFVLPYTLLIAYARKPIQGVSALIDE